MIFEDFQKCSKNLITKDSVGNGVKAVYSVEPDVQLSDGYITKAGDTIIHTKTASNSVFELVMDG